MGRSIVISLRVFGFGNLRGLFSVSQNSGQPTISDELRGGWGRTSPKFRRTSAKSSSHRVAAFFRRYVEVFQDNGYVHVDHDEEGHDNVAAEEDDAYRSVPAVSSDRRSWVLHIRSQSGGLLSIGASNPSQPAEVVIMNKHMILFPKVSKLNMSSMPASFFTYPKLDMPNMEKINMIKNRSKPMLKRAGVTSSARTVNVRIPLAPRMSRRTRPILASRMRETA